MVGCHTIQCIAEQIDLNNTSTRVQSCLSISITLFNLIRKKKLCTLNVGNSSRVPHHALLGWLSNHYPRQCKDSDGTWTTIDKHHANNSCTCIQQVLHPVHDHHEELVFMGLWLSVPSSESYRPYHHQQLDGKCLSHWSVVTPCCNYIYHPTIGWEGIPCVW